MAWREPLVPILSMALPIFFLAVIAIMPGGDNAAEDAAFTGDARFTTRAYLLPVSIGMAVLLIALICLPLPFVRDRESHWLRRISTTPAPRSWLLSAQTVVNAVLAVVAVAVLTIGVVVLLDVAAPAAPAWYALAALLLITALFAVGLLIAAVAPTTGVAEGLGWGLYLPLLFLGGGMGLQRGNMGPVLGAISDYTPLMAASQAMRDAMLGTMPSAGDLLVLLAWTVVGGLAAVRFFRWE
jgi:ABC-2 type transport system permease protein